MDLLSKMINRLISSKITAVLSWFDGEKRAKRVNNQTKKEAINCLKVN